MTWFGEAWAITPNSNSRYLQTPEDPGRAGLAAITKAMELRGTCSRKEQLLIETVARLYDYEGTPADRTRYVRYVDELRELRERYSSDDQIATIFAGAVMTLTPWDYFTPDGHPRPRTLEALAALEEVLARTPKHPGANHYLIHLVENSRDPGQALASAEILGDLMPNVGHIVHMPSHIYVRLGMFDRILSVNRASMRATKEFMKHWEGYEFPNGISYPGSAQTHDMHAADFINFAGVLMGNYAEARQAARYSADDPRTLANAAGGGAQARLAWPFMTDVRFGQWEAVLAASRPDPAAKYAVGIWHWARGMALVATGDPAAAREELAELSARASDDGMSELLIRANRADELLSIAGLILRARLAEQEGENDEATLLYGEAIRREDALPYIEPLNWFTVARQHLGHHLLAEGRPAEAEILFWEDLGRFPKNIWSLHGVWKALVAQDEPRRAAEARARLDVALSKADVAFD